jgi:iron complex transport system ATP-binding protein
MPEPAIALELAGVRASYGTRVALHDVGIRIRAGEFVALAGPNGSGKTTVLRIALGLGPPAEGEVRLFGERVESLPIAERARRAAWVPQSEDPRDDVRLIDYVLYGRYAHHTALEGLGRTDRQIAERVLQEVGLAGRAHDGIRSISGGERQRAILARALAQEAPLLLLDEPTTHLDVAHQLDLLDRVRRRTREAGTTVVAALHDLNLAARYADRIVVLSRGRVVADGPPSSVLSEELLLRVWGVVADLRPDPRTGRPYLIPRRLAGAPDPVTPGGPGPVHVIGGGGTAAPILRDLVDAGFRVTTGVVNLLDTDAEAAESLGVPAALEAPFAPIGAEARSHLHALLTAARAIVITPVPFGPSNLANLEEVRSLAPPRPILLVRGGTPRERDFTGGRATRILEELRAAGAVELDGSEALTDALAGALGPRPATLGGEGDGTDRDLGTVPAGKLVEEPR